MDAMNKDIFELLHINKGASASLIKKAFRNFAKKNHPDFFPGDAKREEEFRQAAAAYKKWSLIQHTMREIQRIKNASQYANRSSTTYKPWSFSQGHTK